MASVLWLDFDTVALASPLTPQFVAEVAPQQTSTPARSPEEEVIAAVDASGLTDEEILDFVSQRAAAADGLMELWDWAHWHGWHMAVGGVTFDMLMDPVLDAIGLDRAARHCGRTDMLYRRRVRFLSPRGVEIRSKFSTAYLGSYRGAGDFVVYVGGNADTGSDANLGHAAIVTSALAQEVPDHPGPVRIWDSLADIAGHLDKEAKKWQASFSSTTAAEG